MAGNCNILSGENKGDNQFVGYHATDLRLCSRKYKNRFSHDAAKMINCQKK